MDNAEVERALDDLDSRLERLRALYEQYFMGIEKLEPLVPRKELDRRIMLLRREQVRNTALRFKFQSLVQRYNTFQQYWQRVAREIDNGTYHRDVARAAARFGAKDALTILGKRQADKYARLIKSQDERRAKAKTTHTIDEDEVLGDDDLLADEPEETDEIVVDDELEFTTEKPPQAAPKAPPPPPPRASLPPPPPITLPAAPPIAPIAPIARPAAPPIAPPIAPIAPPLAPIARPAAPPPPPPRASIPPPPPPMGTRPAAAAPPLPPPTGAKVAVPPPPPLPRPSAPELEPAAKPVEPARKPDPVSPMMMMRRTAEAPTLAAKPVEGAAADAATKPADPDAGKRRVAELAAQVKQTKAAAGPVSARPLDLDFDLDEKNSPASRRKPSSTRIRAVRPATGADEPAPSVPSPSSRRKSSRAMRAVSAPEPPEPPKEAPRAEPAPAAAAPEPEEPFVPPARPPAAAARRRPATNEESLSDSRMRQIYTQYVEAKRAAKESTAGVTYEALAQQLRQQAEKLKATHPHRSVDYNVVMKDGKPTLKPILR